MLDYPFPFYRKKLKPNCCSSNVITQTRRGLNQQNCLRLKFWMEKSFISIVKLIIFLCYARERARSSNLSKKHSHWLPWLTGCSAVFFRNLLKFHQVHNRKLSLVPKAMNWTLLIFFSFLLHLLHHRPTPPSLDEYIEICN